MNNRYCIITAGGAGTRLWPLSRIEKPKQFLDFSPSGKSLLRDTFDRISKIIPLQNIIVITADRYRHLVREQIPELSQENLLSEPYRRNTATCITYATYTILKRNPDAEVIVSPSDQLIENESLYAEAIERAFDFIRVNNVLVTLGIKPTRPDTNYGYIQATGGKTAYQQDTPVKVKTFTEKPDISLAKVFIKTEEFFWNSGIYVWKAATFKEEIEKFIPEICKLFSGWEQVLGTPLEQEFIQRAYTDCVNISIDNAVMSKSERAWIYPVQFGWADLGNWNSLYQFYPGKDSRNNAVNSEAAIIEQTSNTLAITKNSKKLVAVKGLDNYMIIDTDDALVICPKNEKQFKEFISGIAMPEFEKYR